MKENRVHLQAYPVVFNPFWSFSCDVACVSARRSHPGQGMRLLAVLEVVWGVEGRWSFKRGM